MPQPVLVSDKGVIITIGLVIRNDRAALVFPAATADAPTAAGLATDAIDAVVTDIIPLLLPMMSPSCYVAFVQAIGMDNGVLPDRADYASILYPGTETGDELPASIGGLACFYGEAADYPAGDRLHHSHMIVPGIGETQVTDGRVDDAYVTLMNDLADKMRLGFQNGGTPTFYRVMAAPAPGLVAQPLPRVAANRTRKYVGQQKRRLLPHY